MAKQINLDKYDIMHYCPKCSCKIIEIGKKKKKNKINSPISEEQYYCPYCGIKMNRSE